MPYCVSSGKINLAVSDTVWHIGKAMETQRQIGRPKAGTYAIRFVKGGWAVPVRIECVDGRWQAMVNGEPLMDASGERLAYTDEQAEAETMAAMLDGSAHKHPFVRLVHYAKAISEAEYRRLVTLLVTAPNWHPCRNPYEPIKMKDMPSLW